MAEQPLPVVSRPGRDEESSWIARIAAGDQEAFERLYQAYCPRIFRYLFALIEDRGTAEELTNDSLVAAWKGARHFRGQSKVSTWLFGIARYKGLNALRSRNVRTVEIAEAGELAETKGGPEAVVRSSQLEQTVREALRLLSPDQREVVELTFYQGLSYQEIAEIMQCPPNTVKTRMFYARKKLEDVFKKAGIAGGGS